MKVALSLSGGGFRATLFHLGVISYLRRVGMLPQVAAVCGVSGGAIIGAHLVQNWERYTGTDEEFTTAALEVIGLTQRDIRGRILRRLPWAIFLKPLKRLRISRCSMFERELSRFFAGEARFLRSAGASHRRNRPELFVLATDLATGKACSFDARGFTRDTAANAGPMLTTVLRTATAVATSASFPGFFPPYKVTAASLGISRKVWGPQPEIYLTDGGVFDNLGVRKLRSLRQTLNVGVEILSDAGAMLEPRPGGFSGLVRTALRAVDILTNRVHELEYERVTAPQEAAVAGASVSANRQVAKDPSGTFDRDAFIGAPVLIPVKINDQFEAEYAPGVSIQGALQRVRTDLDRFSDTEVRWLVRHGGNVARHAIEQRASLLTDVDLNRGKQPPWDPMPALHPRCEWPEPDDKDAEREWKKLENADRRRLGLFSLKDPVSWINLVALAVVTVVALLVVTSVTTRASFLSQAYDESYSVTFEYTQNSAKEWAQEQESHPELIHYMAAGNVEALAGVPAELARMAREYRNNAGRRGQGRAFVRVIPPPGFKLPPDLDEGKRREAIADMRLNPMSLWKGILYYRFPSIAQDRMEAFAVPGLGVIAKFLPNWQDPVTVLQFQGHATGGSGKQRELCLDFAQDGRSFSRFSMTFQIESRSFGPPIVPRNGNLIRPRSRPAHADALVARSPDPCGIADDGFVLGMMRLE